MGFSDEKPLFCSLKQYHFDDGESQIMDLEALNTFVYHHMIPSPMPNYITLHNPKP